MEKKIQSISPFKNLRQVEGIKKFDKYWISYVPYDVVQKTGEGEEDFVIVTKFKEKKIDIRQALSAEAQKCVDVAKLVENFELTGDESLLPPAWKGEPGRVDDYTGLPSDLAEALDVVRAGQEAFNGLNPDLKAGRNMEDFASSISDQEAIAFIKSYLSNRFGKKDEAGKEEK